MAYGIEVDECSCYCGSNWQMVCAVTAESDSSTDVGWTYPYLLLREETCLAGETKAVRGVSASLGCRKAGSTSVPPSTLNGDRHRVITTNTSKCSDQQSAVSGAMTERT